MGTIEWIMKYTNMNVHRIEYNFINPEGILVPGCIAIQYNKTIWKTTE